MNLKRKLALTSIAVITLIIASYLVLIFSSEVQLKEKINENYLTSTAQWMHELEHIVEMRIEYWQVFGETPAVRKMIFDSNQEFGQMKDADQLINQRDKEWQAVPKNEPTPFMKELLGNELSSYLNAKKFFYEKKYGYSIYPEVFITNKYGAVIGSTGKTTDYYQADEAWWQMAVKEGLYLEDVEYDDSSETYSMVASIRIDDEKGDFLGVAKVLINTEEMVRHFEEMMAERKETGSSLVQLTLINNDRKVIYQTGKKSTLAPLSPHEQEEFLEMEAREGEVLLVKSDLQEVDEEVVVHHHFLQERFSGRLDWILVAEFNPEMVLSPIIELRTTALILSLAFIAIVVAISFFVTSSVYTPIHLLRQATEKVEKGNFGYRVKIKSKDELGLLGRAFNHMAEELEKQRLALIETAKNRWKVLGYKKKYLEKEVKTRTSELEHSKKMLEMKAGEAEEAKKATLNVLEDIEEAQKKLKKSYEELKGLDKLKTEFLSFTSHELRTPLTPIRSQLQRLLSQDLPKSERQESLEMILRNTLRLDKLINDILDISRIESNRLQIFKKKTDLCWLINSVVKQTETFAREKGIKIRLDLKHCPSSVPLDSDRMEQVFVNLLDNAIKHSGTKEILITGHKKEHKVEVCVIDKGQGIPAEEIPHLFEAFKFKTSAKAVPQSAGLGLAICRGIVRAHGGNIWFKTKAGQGTTFYVDLPL